MGIKDKIPCIRKKGLKVFQDTADGRFRIGKDLFLATHYPMSLQRESTQPLKASDRMAEFDLLKEIQDIEKIGVKGGNRIYFLFGVTGSGKSELSKWLEVKLKETERGNVVHRISKSELQIPQIVDKFKKALPDQKAFLDVQATRHMEKIAEMPKITAQRILSNACMQLLKNDDEALLVMKRLLPAITKGIEQGFTPGQKVDSEVGSVIEPLPQRTFKEELEGTEIIEKLGYEELSKKLSENINEILLGGANVVEILADLSKHIMKKLNTRPVLLVDDIVQSLNLYVVQLLDYFMDFSRGNWDVVIGITPAFLELTDKGKQILTRITEQNTITERVTKLLLTDEIGESYALHQENCVDFIGPYLNAYKRENGFFCNSECRYRSSCIMLGSTESIDETNLAPFNSILLQRIFNDLPRSLAKYKGKARAFTQQIKILLEKMAEQNLILPVLEENIESEIRAECKYDDRAAVIAKFFIPSSSGETLTVPPRFLTFFDIPSNISGEVTVDVMPLGYIEKEQEEEMKRAERGPDPHLVAISKWIDGKTLTSEEHQQLLNLRKGVVGLVLDFLKPGELSSPLSSNPTGKLMWKGKIQETDPPVKIDGIDEKDGVKLDRSLRRIPFWLHHYSVDEDNRESLKEKILNSEEFGSLLLSARSFSQRCLERISHELGLEVEELALYLYLLSVGIHGPYEIIPPIPFNETKEDWKYLFNKTDRHLPQGLGHLGCSFTESQVEDIREIFDDFFKIRENVYDGYRLKKLLENLSISYVIDKTLSSNENNVPNQFMVGNRSLTLFIKSIKKNVGKLAGLIRDEQALKQLKRFERLEGILNKVDENTITIVKQKFLEIEGLWSDLQHEKFSLRNLQYSVEKYKNIIQEIKDKIEQTSKHLWRPIQENPEKISPLLLLRFLYKIGELEGYDLINQVSKIDAELGRLEERLESKEQKTLEVKEDSVERFAEKLNELEGTVTEFFQFRMVNDIIDAHFDCDSIEKLIKTHFFDSAKLTRTTIAGCHELRIDDDETHKIRVYDDSIELEKWVKEGLEEVDREINFIALSPIPQSLMDTSESELRRLIEKNYGKITLFFLDQPADRAGASRVKYVDTIKSPLSYFILTALRRISSIATMEELKLYEKSEEGELLEQPNPQKMKNESDLKMKANALLQRVEIINSTEKKINLLDSINTQMNMNLIRQATSWNLLFNFLQPNHSKGQHIKSLINLLCDTIHSSFASSVEKLEELNDNLAQSIQSLKSIQQTELTPLRLLLSAREKYWKAVNLLKLEAPTIGELFPIEQETIEGLIKKIIDLNLFVPDQTFNLLTELAKVLKILTDKGVDVGSLDKLRGNLSSESFQIIMQLLQERKSISLSEVNIALLSEIEKKFPEILKIITLTIRQP